QSSCEICARATDKVNGKPWKQAVPDIQSLRHSIERKGDESPMPCLGALSVLQCALHELIADAATLVARGDKQLREKPQIAAGPTKADSAKLIRFFRDPQAARIILQREQLKVGRARRRHRPEAMTLGEIVDATDNQLVGALQIIGAGRSVDKRHAYSSGAMV